MALNLAVKVLFLTKCYQFLVLIKSKNINKEAILKAYHQIVIQK